MAIVVFVVVVGGGVVGGVGVAVFFVVLNLLHTIYDKNGGALRACHPHIAADAV